MEVQGQLEAKILQLQDRLSQATRPVRRGVSRPIGVGGVTANVDIRQAIPEGSVSPKEGVSIGVPIGARAATSSSEEK